MTTPQAAFSIVRANLLSVCCSFLGVPPGRGSCPLTGPLPFDLIYTDYHGLQQMKQHMGLSLKKHKSVDVYCVCVHSACYAHTLYLSDTRARSLSLQ